MNREENCKKIKEFDDNLKTSIEKRKSEIKELLENPKFYNHPNNEYWVKHYYDDKLYDRTDMGSDIFIIHMDYCDHNIVSEIVNVLESSKKYMERLTVEIFQSDPRTGISYYSERLQLIGLLFYSVYKDIPKSIYDRLKFIKSLGITLKLTFVYHYVNPYLY